MKKKDAIQFLNHCLYTHILWARYQQRRYRENKEPVKFVGGKSFHYNLAQKYSEVIKNIK